MGSMNQFEEFYGFSVTYQELEQQSYVEFKDIMFENINPKIKFRKYGRIGNILTVRAEMYKEEIQKFEELIQNNKIKTIYDWIVKDVTIFVILEGIIDFDKEIQRHEKEIGKLAKELASVSRKLSNEDFLGKAPAQVVTKVKERHGILLEKEQKTQINLDRIKKLV